MEIELKLRATPAALARLTRHPLMKAGQRFAAQKLRAIYYDTPDLDLSRKGIALRVRREGARWIQTVKWSGDVRAGLHERNELEVEVPGPALDCSRLQHPDIDALFHSPQITGALQPVFQTIVTRSKRLLTLDDQAIVEASFDRGEIRSGKHIEEVSELELELKRGDPHVLFRLASDLVEAAPVALEIRSKAERGYALYQDKRPAPVKAATPALVPEMSVSAGFAAIAWTTMKQLQGNEQGVLAGEDPEFLHQLRVGLRRLRSALSAFSHALPEKARQPVIKDLRGLGRALSPARDWDVFMTETLPAIRRAFQERDVLSAFGEECAKLHATAQGRARRRLRSRTHQRVMIRLATWIESQAWREHAEDDRLAVLNGPIRQYAQAELERRYERVRKRGRKIEALDSAELHRLRIAIKKMRYTTDFFASLFDAAAVERLRSRLSRLQDVLGATNDAAMTAQLAGKAVAGTRAAALLEARGTVLGWSAGRADALRDDLNGVWRAFRRTETFW